MGVKGMVQDVLDAMTLEELQGIIPDPQPDTPPQITAQLVRDVVADLIEIEAVGGYRVIAKKWGLRERQVRTLDRMRLAEIAERTAEQE